MLIKSLTHHLIETDLHLSELGLLVRMSAEEREGCVLNVKRKTGQLQTFDSLLVGSW